MSGPYPPDLWDFAVCPVSPCRFSCCMSGRCTVIDREGWERIDYDTLSPRLAARPVVPGA